MHRRRPGRSILGWVVNLSLLRKRILIIFSEPTLCKPRFPHAVLTDQRRSNQRSNKQSPKCPRWQHLSRRDDRRRRQCHRRGHLKGWVLETKNRVCRPVYIHLGESKIFSPGSYLKQAALKLRDDFDSDVPKTVDELCSLPGVGPKMSFLTLQIAWGLNHGIGVDVHIHRITNLLGWHKPPTKNPEQTRCVLIAGCRGLWMKEFDVLGLTSSPGFPKIFTMRSTTSSLALVRSSVSQSVHVAMSANSAQRAYVQVQGR